MGYLLEGNAVYVAKLPAMWLLDVRQGSNPQQEQPTLHGAARRHTFQRRAVRRIGYGTRVIRGQPECCASAIPAHLLP